MSEPLTAAGLREHRERLERLLPDSGPEFWEEWDKRLDDYAARAVDEVLSVERVAEALAMTLTHKGKMGSKKFDCDSCRRDATALVAHLRGPHAKP
jgi:hypothetical protein